MFLSLTKSGWSVEVSDKNEVIWLQNTNDAPTGSAAVLWCSGPVGSVFLLSV